MLERDLPKHEKGLIIRSAVHAFISAVHDIGVGNIAEQLPAGQLIRSSDGVTQVLARGKIVDYGGMLAILDSENVLHLGHLAQDSVIETE